MSFKRPSRYLTDDNYFETLSNDRKIDMSWLVKGTKPDLEYKEYTYEGNGSKYAGEWLGGFRHGNGTQSFMDGTCYTGEWFLGRAHGKGKFHNTKTGLVYDGQFNDDIVHGYGKLEREGTIYIGDFNFDRRHGFGIEKDAEGNIY